MTIIGYVKPTFKKESYTCPHCNCFAQHHWCCIRGETGIVNQYEWMTSCCLSCTKYCFWQDQLLVWPLKSGLPDPVDGCPEAIKAVYNEAREVFPHSVRASAALLRLVIQRVCVEKGLPGKDLNSDVGALVKSGLPVQVQQSLDLVRVVGNNAVHPGQIDFENNKEHVEGFFGLVNIIVDLLIVQPAKISAMYAELVPPAQQQQVASRDSRP